jgi:2-amino-4-hydroxy-6-hydroxymethyldihydropteridine diphosphokinase
MIRQPASRGQEVPTTLRCGIALGSNLGDRMHSLRLASEALGHLADFAEPVLRSAIYETAPVGCAPDAPRFLNAVIEIGFFGSPELLLERLRAIECALGRASERATNAPRPIDLDLLYAGDLVVRTGGLELPHPRLTQRRFVLEPLCDIRPDLLLPGEHRTVRELLAALPPDEPPGAPVTREWR